MNTTIVNQQNNAAKTPIENNEQQNDRYVSFCGLDCDLKADELLAMLDQHLSDGNGDPKWQTYFTQKREVQKKLNHDNLNFVGHQTNTLYEYFDICEDQQAKELLYQIEQNCC
ncbi:N(2)-fixation sustaining protein CowN [Psychromonas sp. PT13]|uniref:N(2)-fixation sustaining protein CowN n=1 Tax=Psychromonas sp. PT13 TaxID=3439547 RepID=UPI003EB84B6A